MCGLSPIFKTATDVAQARADSRDALAQGWQRFEQTRKAARQDYGFTRGQATQSLREQLRALRLERQQAERQARQDHAQLFAQRAGSGLSLSGSRLDAVLGQKRQAQAAIQQATQEGKRAANLDFRQTVDKADMRLRSAYRDASDRLDQVALSAKQSQSAAKRKALTGFFTGLLGR